jgi:hypothetical protein
MLSVKIITPIDTRVAQICQENGALMLYAKFMLVNTILTLLAMLWKKPETQMTALVGCIRAIFFFIHTLRIH